MKDKLTSIRLSDDDRALIVDLKQRYGVTSMRQVIRLALRMLAERKAEANADDDDGPGSLFVEVE